MTLDDALEFTETCSEEDVRKIRTIAERRIKAFNKSRKSAVIVTRYSAWSMEMARVLWASVQAHFPLSKSPDLEAWASDIDKMERLDKLPREVIERALTWSQQDNFWQNQIRSGAALRKYYDKMEASARTQAMDKKKQPKKSYKV